MRRKGGWSSSNILGWQARPHGDTKFSSVAVTHSPDFWVREGVEAKATVASRLQAPVTSHHGAVTTAVLSTQFQLSDS